MLYHQTSASTPVAHQSPRVLLVRDDQAVKVLNHYRIKVENIKQAVSESGLFHTVQEKSMVKPFVGEILEKSDHELLEKMHSLQEFAGKDGALPVKVKTLMSMLVDAILGHPDGVKALADMARAQGATESEIAETVRVAFLSGGMPGLVTGTHAFRK